MSLRPFWRYYGGKYRYAPHYPPPDYETIIEPFAGAAGYSLRYPRRRVVLVDANPIIAGIWRYLIATPADEIRALPDIPEGGTVDDIDAPQEARWLAGFTLAVALHRPRCSMSPWMRWGIENGRVDGWTTHNRARIANQVEQIRHWTIIEGDYTQAPDVEATWFVDPPYQGRAGRHYPFQPADFAALGEWCKGRRGQVIVCEQEGATWLPFLPLGSFRSASAATRPRRSAEVIWTNRPSQYGGTTVALFGGGA